MRVSSKISCLVYFCAFFFVNFSAHADPLDFTENDLNAPISDTGDYANVTINNNRTLTSGSVLGGYVYLGGSLNGDISLTNDGSITSTHSNYGVLYMPNVGNLSLIKDVNVTNDGSLISTGTFASTVYIIGKNDGSFPDFTRRSFDFSLDNSGAISSAGGAVNIINGSLGTYSITNTGTISSTTSSINVITLSGGESATINNRGSIEANTTSLTAIQTDAANSVINNGVTLDDTSAYIKGKIVADGGVATSLTVTNYSAAGIDGNITTTNANLDIINHTGTITGNINLGDNESSSISLNGGSIVGNVTMGNSSQVLTFDGGTLTGTVNGAGAISVNSNYVSNGNIGNSTSITSLEIAANTTLNAVNNQNSISATNITLRSGSILSMGDGVLTGNVDGVGGSVGTLNMTFTANADINAVIGTINGIAELNIDDAGISVTANEDIKASQVNLSGIDGALTLDSGVTITGDVAIGDRSNLVINNGAEVVGDITAVVNGSGTLQFSAGSYTITNEIGTASFKLGNVTLLDNTSLTTSNNIRASTITIGGDSTLTSSAILSGDIELQTGSILELQNGATVSGDINPGGIVEVGVVNTSGTVTIAGQIGTMGGIGDINVQTGSTLNIGNNDSSGTNSIEIENFNITGQLNLTDETTINGNVTMLGSSSIINASGNDQTINGNFTTASGSQINLTVHSASAADQFVVSGVATIVANTKLNITIASGASVDGASYVIVDGGSGSSINVISSSDILVNGSSTNRFGKLVFSTSLVGDNLLLNVNEQALSPNVRSNQSQIYDAIVNASAASGTALYQLQQYVEGDASDSNKEEILTSALPQIDNSNNRISFNVASESLALTSDRINQVLTNKENNDLYFAAHQNKSAARDFKVFGGEEKQFSFWSQIFGSNIKQGNTSISEGYSANVRGLAFGLDKKIENDLVVGISGSYAKSNSKSISDLKKTDIDSYQINLYSGHNFEKFYVNNLIGFVWNEYKSNRNILIANASASANYSGQNYIARSEIGFNKKLPENFVISPSAMFTAAHNVVEDYSETGSSNINLAVKNKSTNFFEVRAGVNLSNKYEVNKINILPNLFASYGYDLAGAKQKTSANFIGQSATFDSTSQSLARGSFKTGFATKIYKIEELSFDLNYTFEKRISYHANSLSLKASYKF